MCGVGEGGGSKEGAALTTHGTGKGSYNKEPPFPLSFQKTPVFFMISEFLYNSSKRRVEKSSRGSAKPNYFWLALGLP